NELVGGVGKVKPTDGFGPGGNSHAGAEHGAEGGAAPVRSIKNVGKEGQHLLPRLGVGLRVVGGSLGGIVSRSLLGEGMDRPGIGDELVVDVGGLHFAVKGLDLC